jgi:hypothetical protein
MEKINIKDIIKTLKTIEEDCSVGASCNTTEVNFVKFYERVKGLMTLINNDAFNKIEEDCKYGYHFINEEKFYQQVKGIIKIME